MPDLATKSADHAPNLFLVGAPKCGTTAISNYLAEHPDIFMSESATGEVTKSGLSKSKEPGFYATDMKNLFGTRWVNNYVDYLKIFESSSRSEIWRGEASVCYLMSTVAIPRILHDTPQARFIVALRNPVKIAMGMHAQRVLTANENITTFQKAWNAQKARRSGKKLPFKTSRPSAYQYGELASVGSQLERMLEIVAAEQVHIVVQDDLKNDPVNEYKKILAFLDLPYDGRNEFEHQNTGKKPKSPVLTQYLMRINKLRRRLHIPDMGLNLYDRLYSIGMTRGKDQLDPEFERQLQDFFTPEVEKLSRILNRDLKAWLE